MAKAKKRGVKGKSVNLPKLSGKKTASKEGSDLLFWAIIVVVIGVLIWLLMKYL